MEQSQQENLPPISQPPITTPPITQTDGGEEPSPTQGNHHDAPDGNTTTGKKQQTLIFTHTLTIDATNSDPEVNESGDDFSFYINYFAPIDTKPALIFTLLEDRTSDGKIILPSNFLPIDKSVSEDYISSVFGAKYENMEACHRTEIKDFMESLKKHLMAFGRREIKHLVVQNCATRDCRIGGRLVSVTTVNFVLSNILILLL